MTYKKLFVAAIKVDGKILRESSDRVELPFGSEYTILLKNLDSVRMQARISIDGKDATGWLVIGPGRDVEVERFVEDLNRGNRFKFIERTARIEEHRGIKAEDGLVRIEFKREKVYEAPKTVEHHTYYYNYPVYGCFGHPVYRGSLGNTTNTFGTLNHITTSGLSSACSNVSTASFPANMAKADDTGITVEGSISNQQFYSVPDFETEAPEVVVLHLVGKTGSTVVKVAKTVKIKIECDTCGTKNKSSFKFCKQCGTSLERV